MKLTKMQIVEIVPVVPFGFDATFHKPDHFASGDNDWKPGIRWQTFHFLKKDIGVVFKKLGGKLSLKSQRFFNNK